MNDTGPIADRMTQLESLVMHLQRDVEALNSVVLRQQKDLEHLRLLLDRMDERLADTTGSDRPRDLLLEKPPHY